MIDMLPPYADRDSVIERLRRLEAPNVLGVAQFGCNSKRFGSALLPIRCGMASTMLV